MLTAVQPWSGHYGANASASASASASGGTSSSRMPVVWATAHMTQFTEIGWRYLAHGSGSGFLRNGGYFTTIADPNTGELLQ